MGDSRSTRPPPPPERIDLVRLELRKHRTPREERPESDEERFARALAAMEGRLLERMADVREQLQEGEDDRPSRVHVQIAPPPSERKHWSVTAGTILAGVLAGGGALVGAVAGLWSQVHHSEAQAADVQACVEFKTQATAKLAAVDSQLSALYDYQLGFRRQVRGAFAAQGLNFPDAQGEPKQLPDGSPVLPLEFLPPPLVGSHHIKAAPILQPAAPLALPPKF